MLEKYTNYWLSAAIQLLVEFSNRGITGSKPNGIVPVFTK
jgi:hypothetical protein